MSWQDSVQNAEDARETVAWLKKYLTMEPPNRTAMLVWGLIQTKYLPDDAAAMHQLYEAYKSATKDVPYTEWLAGWVNLVELSMVDNHVEEAANTGRCTVAHQLEPALSNEYGILLVADLPAAR